MNRARLKELIHKFLRSSKFEIFARNKITRMVVPIFPWKFQKVLLSSLTLPRKIRFGIENHELSIFSSMEDDHFQRAYLQKMQGWETASLSAFLKLIEPDSTVIDVGAYLGIYSILAIKQGANKVISYEPNPNTYMRLVQSLELNQLGNGVITRNVALGDRSGSRPFITPIGRNFSSGAKMIENEELIQSGWEVIADVPVLPLDEDLKTIDLGHVSVLKIDAEGAEFEILRGAEKLLKAHMPKIICEFLTSESLEQAASMLLRLGYNRKSALFQTSIGNNEIQINEWSGAGNYLFYLAK